MHVRVLAALLVGLTACAQPQPASEAERACRALLAAPPGEWAVQVPPVLALGRPAAATLAREVAGDPSAPGAQAAAACLGALGDLAVTPTLVDLLRSRGGAAYEAALALGRLRASEATAELRAARDDTTADPIVRTAAAAALLDLGLTQDALPLLLGVLRADTPAGRSEQERLRLPSRPRWALERHVAIAAVRRSFGSDFGLDPDLSWPDLEAASQRLAQAAEARKEGR
ncbi:MAG: hypothetical protein IT458_05395 [Planctomycetes bacterium]|nr:hypothetical protein [Planctomycetota bacterium]